MNSRWQANKIGLLNFWYYDEQEFPFVKGRMLLRGSNGSGKSVTMQSVVPLLLDGNMSPERLDPFGSKDRKMSGYLLEEDDGREERTGYLYLEFKRQDSDIFSTIGMGIRARRGKNLEKWYFCIFDGRRIGHDFFLYKDIGERIPLSRKELEYRIGQGGKVMERQADYMEYVNQKFFGFETVEEYKEMVDLLIRLRTPKLSKDFKPSVINEILSESLQPLSDDDLRPMSEAIENMDTMNLNLEKRRGEEQAAEKIQASFAKYNRLMLLEKAKLYEQAREKLQKMEGEHRANQTLLETLLEEMTSFEQQKMEIEMKRETIEKEKDSLGSSDALQLKTREAELRNEIGQIKKLIEEKNNKISEKQERYIDVQQKIREEEANQYEKEQEIQELFDEMAEEAEDMAFEEFHFMEQEIKEHWEEGYAYDSHQKIFEATKVKILEGSQYLEEILQLERQKEDLLKRREKKILEMDQVQKDIFHWESMLLQTKSEWKEALYKWHGENKELHFSEEFLKECAAFIDQYDVETDFAQIREKVADYWIETKGILEKEIQSLEIEVKELQNEKKEVETKLKEWESFKEPEPERSAAVIKNRKRLQELQIPYQEFYKAIEFGNELDKVTCDHIEEALLEMGILDAIIVDEKYREKVLELESGCADHYLFTSDKVLGKSLLEILELNEEVNDIFMNQCLNNILASISFEEQGTLTLSSEGVYQMGILTGTITGEHEAGFLGTQARENLRKSKILECQNRMLELEVQIKDIREKCDILEKRKSILLEEYRKFPIDQDIREALKNVVQAEHIFERLREEAKYLENEIKNIAEQLQEKKKQVLALAEKLYIACTYEAFQKAKEAAMEYQQHIVMLKAAHTMLQNSMRMVTDQREYLEDIDQDLDQLRYDITLHEQKQYKMEEECTSIVEQLKLTNYEEIKERLDYCVKWLNGYLKRLENCINEISTRRERAEGLRIRITESEKQILETEKQVKVFKQFYEAERQLHYIEIPEGVKEDVSAIRIYLSNRGNALHKEDVLMELNRVYAENKSILNDFQITQVQLFGEWNEEEQLTGYSPRRLDLLARYQGTRITFSSLLVHLAEEIQELNQLIKDGDRELFEDILANTISRKIRGKINASHSWVEKMNRLMSGMNTSSSLKLSLKWRSKTAEKEEQLDTKELVNLLKKDYRMMGEKDAAKLSAHFRSKVEEARRKAKDQNGMISFYQVMKETLDYRKWFEFQLFSQKNGERLKELTNSVFGTFSGGEKAMSMYVPLFSAVVAKYQGGSQDAPRLISLDEAFAGVDNRNIRDMFRLMSEFEFDFIINSQVLWGDSDTLDALAIYQLIRPENAKFVTVMSYIWNGRVKQMLENEIQMEQKAKEL